MPLSYAFLLVHPSQWTSVIRSRSCKTGACAEWQAMVSRMISYHQTLAKRCIRAPNLAQAGNLWASPDGVETIRPTDRNAAISSISPRRLSFAEYSRTYSSTNTNASLLWVFWVRSFSKSLSGLIKQKSLGGGRPTEGGKWREQLSLNFGLSFSITLWSMTYTISLRRLGLS